MGEIVDAVFAGFLIDKRTVILEKVQTESPFTDEIYNALANVSGVTEIADDWHLPGLHIDTLNYCLQFFS